MAAIVVLAILIIALACCIFVLLKPKGNKNDIKDNTAPNKHKHKMKWYYFTIYGRTWLCIIGVFLSIFPIISVGFKTITMLSFCFILVMAASVFSVLSNAKSYTRNELICIYAFLIFKTLDSVLALIVNLIQGADATTVNTNLLNIVVGLIILALDLIYFHKRKYLFKKVIPSCDIVQNKAKI